jgi:hypothetical protein
MKKITALDVAKWMKEIVLDEEILYQETAVYDIIDNFGEEFVYYNQNGNPAISKDVLKEFRKLTEESVVWVRGERMWRKRTSDDDPQKRQSDW